MGKVYHGSKEHGITRLEPRKSTHGVYVYATPHKVLAIHFSGRCGDDVTYDLGHFGSDKNGPWELVENIPGALEKMYANSSSIYSFSDETFKDIHTGFAEVVSEVGVDVVEEECYESVYDAILELEREGLLKIYRYPDKPIGMKPDGSDILDKYRYYKYKLNKEISKNDFDRLVYLRPNLLEQINELIKEFGYGYSYTKSNIIEIFKSRIARQLRDLDYEQYIESSYQSISEVFPELISEIDVLFGDYREKLEVLQSKTLN